MQAEVDTTGIKEGAMIIGTIEDMTEIVEAMIIEMVEITEIGAGIDLESEVVIARMVVEYFKAVLISIAVVAAITTLAVLTILPNPLMKALLNPLRQEAIVALGHPLHQVIHCEFQLKLIKITTTTILDLHQHLK